MAITYIGQNSRMGDRKGLDLRQDRDSSQNHREINHINHARHTVRGEEGHTVGQHMVDWAVCTWILVTRPFSFLVADAVP